MTSDEIDCSYTDEAVCPWCGYVHTDTWECFLYGGSDETEIECDECQKSFIVYRNVSVHYSTYQKKEEVK